MRYRVPARVRVLPRQHVTTTVTLNVPGIQPDGTFRTPHFEVNELLTLVHMNEKNWRVTHVKTEHNLMSGGWDILNASTNERLGHITQFPHGKEKS